MTTRYTMVPARRTHVGLIILLVVCAVAALGFYQGWFTVTENRELNNKVDVNLRVDTNKIKNDVRTATDKTSRRHRSCPIKSNKKQKTSRGVSRTSNRRHPTRA